MVRKKDVPLKIELFSDGEDSQFRVRSKKEIQSILSGIAQDRVLAALYFDEGNDFILTTLLNVEEKGMWLDIGSIAASNQRILRSDKIVFIGSHHQVKVQFVANRIETASFEDRAAFYLPMPDSLLRIQRREYFRLTAPARNPLKCVIPPVPSSVAPGARTPKREATIMDISGGGVALVCEAQDAELRPGETYADCQISLPGIGIVGATIKVKNAFEVTLRSGLTSKRAGCEFIGLGGEAATLLQRYITQLQREALVRD